MYRRNREGVQEEPRGIVSVYVTPRVMGAKVVQEVLVGNLKLYRRTDLADLLK